MMVASELSAEERAVLDVIQTDFPLCADPYATVGAAAGCTREAAHATVQGLRARGIIRRLGGSFAASRLGYRSTLVAAQVEARCLETVAARASRYPEVTHNYQRDGAYNLWFTVIARDDARLGAILDAVRACPGVAALHALPATRTFKVRVAFRFGTAQREPGDPAHGEHHAAGAPVALDAVDRRVIARCCGDLDGSLAPFAALAREIQITEEALLARLTALRMTGALRRFGAILRHQQAGYVGNGMSVWRVPEAALARVGPLVAAHPAVTHCYARPPLPEWPYTLYAMLHGPDHAACLDVARSLAEVAGGADYRVLLSVREFKKTSMVYFAETLQPAAPCAASRTAEE